MLDHEYQDFTPEQIENYKKNGGINCPNCKENLTAEKIGDDPTYCDNCGFAYRSPRFSKVLGGIFKEVEDLEKQGRVKVIRL